MSLLQPDWIEEDESPGLTLEGKPRISTVGRAKRVIDRDVLIRLAQIGCTSDEIGRFFGVESSLVRRRFGTLLHQVKAQSKARLRQAQFELAIDQKDKTMLIWLGKQFLGQSELGERNSEDRQPLPWNNSDLPEEFLIGDVTDEEALQEEEEINEANNTPS